MMNCLQTSNELTACREQLRTTTEELTRARRALHAHETAVAAAHKAGCECRAAALQLNEQLPIEIRTRFRPHIDSIIAACDRVALAVLPTGINNGHC
jgi:hypothetical protein